MVKRKHSAIEHGVASQTVGDPPAKRFAVILPRQGPAEWLRALVMALVGPVDFWGDRELVTRGCVDVKVDDACVLQPRVCIDPQIALVSRKMAAQKRPSYLRLESLGHLRAPRKVE